MGLFDFFIKKKSDGPITSYGKDNLTDTGFDFNNKVDSFNLETNNNDNSSLEYTNFYFKIEDKFTITGKGTVVVGKVESGTIKNGEEVYLKNIKTGEILKTQITGIEMFRKLLDTASAGDNVGLLLRGIARNQIDSGDILYKE